MQKQTRKTSFIRQKLFYREWIAVALCSFLLLPIVLTGCSKDVGSWKVTSFENSVLTQEYTGVDDRLYVLTADVSAIDAPDYDPEQDLFLELYGQFFTSIFAFDYPLHYSLFPETVVNEALYSSGHWDMPLDEMYTKINTVMKDTFGIKIEKLEVRYSLIERKVNDPSTKEAFAEEFETSLLSNCEIDLNKIEEFAEYSFDNIDIIYNDTFSYLEQHGFFEETSTIVFFKYEGEWYVDPNSVYLDDDAAIDIAESDPGEDHGCYEIEHSYGNIEKIKNGYVVLANDDEAFYMGDINTDLKIGDRVEIQYYEGIWGGVNLKQISDGTIYKSLYKIVSIEKIEDSIVVE